MSNIELFLAHLYLFNMKKKNSCLCGLGIRIHPFALVRVIRGD